MNSLIDRLREAKTMIVADPLLRELKATPVQMKLVEASILQRLSPDPSGYEYGVSMLNTVIRELDPEEEPASPESTGLKVKDKKLIKEETLDNNNPNTGNTGSEQSTENTAPYTGEGKKTGDEDMLSAPDTENQMSETDAPFPKNLNQEMGGMHPDIAKQVGDKMPKIPPMDTATQMKQTRYTIQKYHEAVVKPLLAHAKIQDAAIQKLSQKIRETEAKTGSYSFDLDGMKNQTNVRVRETVVTPGNSMEHLMATRIQNKDFELNQARNEILEANNQMSN